MAAPDDDDDVDSDRPTIVPKYDVEAAARAAAIPSSMFPRDHRPEMQTVTDPIELEAARVASTFTSPPPAIEIMEGEVSEDAITGEYAAAFGSFERVPYLAMSSNELTALNLEPRAGFLLALVDGALDIQTILDVSGMPVVDTLAILEDLLNKRVVALR